MRARRWSLIAALLLAACSGDATQSSTPLDASTPIPSAAGATPPHSTPGKSAGTTLHESTTPGPAFPIGAELVTVSDLLRVRSMPRVSDDSRMFEPLLPIGTRLHVTAGPVIASGYSWYRVELLDGQTLYEGIDGGWVAAAGHDGTPWINWYADIDPGSPAPSPITGWPRAQRGDIVMTAGVASDNAPFGDGGRVFSVTVSGLLPGTRVYLQAAGTYRSRWVCGEPPEPSASEPPLGWGIEDLAWTEGSVEASADGVANERGSARTTIRLRPSLPEKICPPAHAGPISWSGGWEGLRLSEDPHRLELRPEAYSWASTM